MPKSKSRKKKSPKRVLALLDLETLQNGRAEQPDVRERPAYLRPRHTRVCRLVLFGATPWVQPHCRSRVPDLPRTAGLCACHHSTFGSPRFGAWRTRLPTPVC
jgi:hypothetical protein